MLEFLYFYELRTILCSMLIVYSLMFLLIAWGFYNDIKKEKTIKKDGLK